MTAPGKVYELISAIAPGRELELAEALSEIIEIVRLVAEDSYECFDELHTAANAILAKLSLNETRTKRKAGNCPFCGSEYDETHSYMCGLYQTSPECTEGKR